MAVTWKQRSFELWLHCQTISFNLFCPSHIKWCTFSECRTNKGTCAFKITSLWAKSSKNLCWASIALRALFFAAHTFPGKSFFWAGVVFCHGTYALTEMLLLLAQTLQNSQQAISATDPLVASQEILVILAKSPFPLWTWSAVFVSIFLNPTSPFSRLPSRIMWVDARKHRSSE